MSESSVTPPDDDHPSSEFYSHHLTFADGTTKIIRLSRLEFLAMVHETIRQPKPGARGPKPTPWKVAYQRLNQMRRARDAIRSKGDEVTKPRILEKMGQRGDRSTVNRWLDAVPMSWKAFLAEGINATDTTQSLGGQGLEPKN